MIDWGTGSYEPTARQLLPAAELVVRQAGPGSGEIVLDIGCGTGNAAIVAAELGAIVTGVDPAARLLEVAEKTARDRGLAVRFVEGTASAVPVEDHAADLVVSIFGVIFAPDPVEAARELARVTAPGGRVVLTAWLPTGGLWATHQRAGAFMQKVLGQTQRPPFEWHDPKALAGLFAPHGFEVEQSVERIEFTGSSPEQYFDEVSQPHPMAVSGLAALADRDDADEIAAGLRAVMIESMSEANEDASGFRMVGEYVVVTASRSGQ